ncbi:MAG: FUSC family protein [Solirubrobacteraceae bacterium]
MLAVGIIAWDPVAGVTMGAGAMLVGIAWRTSGGRPPLVLMATDAVVMASSTFVGSVTGSLPLLHLALLCTWSLLGGLLVAAGNRGGVIGTQAIIAIVVFGRFSQPASAALGLAALVLAGGGAQVAFQSIVRWPPPLRAQRAATATAYRALSALAAAPPEASTLPAAVALDAAQDTLASPTLFGDPALMTLRSLVDEGHRMRVALSAIHTLLRQRRRARVDGGPGDRATALMQLTAASLDHAARAIEGDPQSAVALGQHVAKHSHEVKQRVDRRCGASPAEPSALAQSYEHHLARRLAALSGQLRAVATMAPAAGAASGLRSRRPRPRTVRPLKRLRPDLGQLRATASLQSPVGRHAVRLAVVVTVAELASRQLPLQRSYWMVVAAATVLRPEFGATFTRGAERALGTCLGVALAGAIAVTLHPGSPATVAIVGLVAWAGYATFPASFAVGFGFITALVVLLLNVIAPDTFTTVTARLLDTLVGGALGLLAYALWPTWSRTPARQSLADLVDAQRAYVKAVLAAEIDGSDAHQPPPEAQLRRLSRAARLARINAEATVARSLAEPQTRRIDAAQSQGSLAATRRLTQAAHVLRLDLEEQRHRPPLPALAPLAMDLDRELEVIAQTLRQAQDAYATALPDLRSGYTAFESSAPDRDAAALLTELDELVDATNGLASLSGLRAVDADRSRRPITVT